MGREGEQFTFFPDCWNSTLGFTGRALVAGLGKELEGGINVMTGDSSPLPRFRKPPVIETVLGVEFAPIAGLSVAHLGAFWGRVKERFPRPSVQAPLAATQDANVGVPKLQFHLVDAPDIRLALSDEHQRYLLQLQIDRLVVNWRKAAPDDPYPSYSANRDLFVEVWRDFTAFLDEHDASQPSVTYCEVTYVNHLEHGAAFASFSDLGSIVPCFQVKSRGRWLPDPDIGGFNLRYPVRDREGVLAVSLLPVVRSADFRRVVQMNLTAKGKAADSNLEGALRWFDIGHEWIVRGFTELTSDAAHRLWEREQ